MVVITSATAGLFLWPRQDEVTSADAVVVLSGDHGERLRFGLEIMRGGHAPVLVLDGQPDSPAAANLCAARLSFEVVCLRPSPDRTRTEAAAAAELAKARNWKRLILVTSTSHTTRARLLFERCVDGEVHAVGAVPSYGIRKHISAIAHEWAGLTRAVLVQRSC